MAVPRSFAPALVVCACTLGVSACAPAAPPAKAEAVTPAHDAAMDTHHLHGLMAHGFEMALEGATLKMTGQMGMAGAVDASAISHGDAMLTEGKALIDGALAGPAMTAMHAANVSDPAMVYTHDLARNMSAVVEHLQQMPPVDLRNPNDMALHHMHIALAHAALMASQGASLKMTASMNMAGAVDQEAAAHAAAMFVHARGLYDEVMKGDAMKAAHAGASGSSTGMTGTHDLGDSISTVIDQLSKMP